MTTLSRRFLDQNDLAGQTLTDDDVEPYADHHAGGLVVLFGYTPDGRCVKLHDSWGGDDTVIVHVYDPDDDDDPDETVSEFSTGRAAMDFFLDVIDSD